MAKIKNSKVAINDLIKSVIVENNNNLTLSDEEIDLRNDRYGKNKIKEKKYNFFLGFLKNFFSPFNIILLTINCYNVSQLIIGNDGGSLSSDDVSSIIQIVLITFMILVSITIGYYQEIKTFFYGKAKKSYDNLDVRVIRNVEVSEINQKNYFEILNKKNKIKRTEIYPGDLIYLKNGDIVPADLKIVYANNLTADQSNITGESYPVSKQSDGTGEKIIEREDICFQNTVIASGYMFGIVLKTGKNVTFNKMEGDKVSRSKDAFSRSLWKISMLLIAYTLVMCPIILTIIGVKSHDWQNALTFAVAVAVGITPEMLPVLVSSNLLHGIKKLPENKIVIKNLSTIQNFGAIDVLCLDKTGTLTNGFIDLDSVITYDQNLNRDFEGKLFLASQLQAGFNNSIDKSIKDKYKNEVFDLDFIKLDELPFDFKRKRSSILVKDQLNKIIQLTKGSPDNIISICTKMYSHGDIIDVTDKEREKLRNKVVEMNSKGYRLVALCEKELNEQKKLNLEDERQMIFFGFATFTDNSKPQAKALIKHLREKNIGAKILTGDDETITKRICEENNIKITGSVSGKALEEMTEEQFAKAVQKNNVFFKLDPLQKKQIIKTLKESGLIVGFIGDGANDVPSFKEANLAISFDDVDPNIQAHANAIIVDDNLSIISETVNRGRIAFGNILKYMKITVSSNIGNMISVLVASLWLPFLPMLSVQILVQNLAYDLSQFSLINDNVDESFLIQPQRLSIRRVLVFSLMNAPISSFFDITTFLVLFFGFGLQENVKEQVSQFNSGWFIVGLLTQTLVMLNYRTQNTNFFKLRIKTPQIIGICGVFSLAMLLPYTPLGHFIYMEKLSPVFIPIAIAIVLGYLSLASFVKWVYIKIFKSWL